MKPKKRFSRTFYEKRSIPSPHQEWWPASASELNELVTQEAERPGLILGDGQHVRTATIGEHIFDVIRTSHCKRVISLDRESKIVRAESGITWGDLQAEMNERGLSLERYRLYPQNSSIGGLLARHSSVGKELWDGNLKSGCIALSSSSPTLSKYRYTAAPRKASGPDSRYLFIGGEGLLGAILDASLVVWKPSDARLFTWDISAVEAIDHYRTIHDLGVNISWAHHAGTRFTVATHGPERLLKGIERELFAHLPGAEVGGRADVSTRRKELETSHPDRRELASSKRTLGVQFSLEHLADSLAELEDVTENVEIWDWSRRRARVFVRFSKGVEPVALPSNCATNALAWQPIIDGQIDHWPQWVQSLKSELDPQRQLVTGP